MGAPHLRRNGRPRAPRASAPALPPLQTAGARVTTRDLGRMLMIAIGVTVAVVIGTPIAGVVLLASYPGCTKEGY